MIIKKYWGFINERLGVPAGIIDSATSLYEGILLHFKDKSTDPNPLGVGEYLVKLEIPIQIADLRFGSVEFGVNLLLHQSEHKVDIISWGVVTPSDLADNYRLLYDKALIEDIKLFINFAITDDAKSSDIYNHLVGQRPKTIGILAHELKHIYDKYMLGKVLLEDIVDYQTWTQTRTGFRPIDEFMFYMYFISKTESLVRPAELAGELVASDITKEEFKEFLKGSSTYRNLLKIKKWSFTSLKDRLLADIKHIRGLFSDLTEETDAEVIDVALGITYESIVKSSGQEMSDILGLNDPHRQAVNNMQIIIFGMSKDVEFFKRYLNKITFNTKEEFFLYCEKKLKFESDKVLRKISKLYDMCKDTQVSPLMAKINQRAQDQCIVNPQLWDKLVVPTKSKYQAKK